MVLENLTLPAPQLTFSYGSEPFKGWPNLTDGGGLKTLISLGPRAAPLAGP